MKNKIYIIFFLGFVSLLFLVLSLFLNINFFIFFFISFFILIFIQFYTLLKYILRIEMLFSNKSKRDDEQIIEKNSQSAQEHPIIIAAKKRLEKKL